MVPPGPGSSVVLDVTALEALLLGLRRTGHELLGPTVRDGAVVLDAISSVAELPRGVGDEQAPGHYRLRRGEDDALFGYASSPQSWKRTFLPPRLLVTTVRRAGQAMTVDDAPTAPAKRALIGVRACDLTALAVQDRVLRQTDAHYAARRDGTFVLAVSCRSPAGTCFCASMGTGPRATTGFDLAATELFRPHRLVVEVGTAAGAEALANVGWRAATDVERTDASRAIEDAATRMGRRLDPAGLAETLARAWEHPRWADVASRCLGCASCTLSCPTCFCCTIEDVTDLSGDVATRTRRWDSCHAMDYAHVHGGTVRPSLSARYRQWLTHKLSSWQAQFGSSGCVGCGRCITWCPVGIDLTEEARAICAPKERAHGAA